MGEPFLRVNVNEAQVAELSTLFEKNERAAALAATETIKTTTANVLLRGRLNIQSSGKFTGPWLKGLQSRQYPKGKNSTNARSFINHKFGGLASVFEFGASIRPKRGKYLWILAPGAPKRMTIGADFGKGWINQVRGRTSAKMFARAAGEKLAYKLSAEGFPMLGLSIKSGKRSRFKPYVIGIPFANIHKRWSIIPIAEAEGDKMVSRFLSIFDKAAD